MVAVITALFFASAAAFAVFAISRSFAGSVDRFDALFAQYRAGRQVRTVEGRMRAVVQFTPAVAPDYRPRNVFVISSRSASRVNVTSLNWRAAA